MKRAKLLEAINLAAIAGLIMLVPAATLIKLWAEKFIVPVHYWVLLFATGAVILFWVASTFLELKLLSKWLCSEKYVAPNGMQIVIACALFVAFLVLLIHNIMNIQWYSFYYMIFSIICVLTNSLWCQIEIAYAEQESRATLSPRKPNCTTKKGKEVEAAYIAHDAIRWYWAKNLGEIEKKNHYLLVEYRLKNRCNWFKNEYFLRHIAYVPACFLVWLLAVIAEFYNWPWLNTVCYWMMIMIIVFGEGILLVWRQKRDNLIKDADKILPEKSENNS